VSLDPRTPVIVGAGQVCHRDGAAPEPMELLAEAARRAEADSGAGGLLPRLGSIRVVHLFSWRYPDPGRLVAELVGASPRHTAYTTVGGQTPQQLLARTAADIQQGQADLVLIGGAECWRTRAAIRTQTGERPRWTTQPDTLEPTEVIGRELVMGGPAEAEAGVVLPVTVYPLFENALRAAAGRGLAEHTRRIAELWARFSEVGAENPHAALQRRYTADEIGTPGPRNRMVGFPYPKLMNSNNHVDQAAAILLASVETARALGVPTDRWVFPVSAGQADDTALSERADLHSSPAIRSAGRAALELAGVEAAAVAHVDLYSCFPSAVQVAAAELGLPLERELTVTGGLTFAGGPWSNYVSHAIATMTGRLRADPGSYGLCSANGGYLSNHAIGVYSTRPPAQGFRRADTQEEVDRLPHRRLAERPDGEAVIESCTVMHDRAGEPERAVAACLLADGRRAWGTSTDPQVMAAMVTDELCGRPVRLEAGGLLVA
jgi:acetyl-CoA C-acetyltransferase